MSLSPGDRLGSYEILAPLGAGGMGEVYRARDPKLNREVAIKILPPALANDADYLTRFQREAQTLASLNHPNIATVYGLEENAIVMELVEGDTLRGPLTLQEALPLAKRIAEAIEAAHDKGIIHRDLKPGNIKVTPEGVVKVLDFGLAKAVERSTQSGADSPTFSIRATEAGLILGTAGYMSPEQAAGKPVDRRADIWSFGVVLYELLTGKRLFSGETVSHTLAHVLTADLDLNEIPAGPIRELLSRCLDRNLRTRLRDIGEARIAIENHLADPRPRTHSPAPAHSRRWLWPSIAAACLLAAVAGWGTLLRRPHQPARSVKFHINAPEGNIFAPTFNEGGSAISPDGQTLAFVLLNAKGETVIHLRALDSLESRPLQGTEDGSRPFWSPDSKSLAFVAAGKLKRVDVAGGSPIILCDAHFARGGTWNEHDLILFSDQGSAVLRIPASGGTPSPVTRLNTGDGETAHYYPQFLPGGKEFLYLVRHSDAQKRALMVGSLDGKPSTRLVQSDHKAVYDDLTGRLLYIQGDGNLMARRLELNPPRLTGDPVVVAQEVALSIPNGFANFSLSSTGTLFYAQGDASASRQFAWRDRTGKLLGTVGQPSTIDFTFRLSPDGTRVAYAVGTANTQLWVMDLARGISTRLTFTDNALMPVWTPDGKQIYYRNSAGIHRKAADGSGEEELVRKGTRDSSLQSISPDGKHLLIGDNDILSLPLNGEPKPVPYLQTNHVETGARFSPDGRWVVYQSNESGKPEIYLQGFPERREKWQVSPAGGMIPQWRADGKELYWWTLGDQTLTAATVEPQATGVRIGPATPLFRLPTFVFQPAPDGKRFLTLEVEGGVKPGTPMTVVQNWAAGLGK